MAVLATTNPTLIDVTTRLDPDGSIAQVAEILNETNEVLMDWTMIEGNLPTGHRTTIRTGIPAPTWRRLYGGVQPTKSTTVQVTDTTGMMEAYAEVDKALADLNGNTAEWMLSENRPHLEGMSQEAATTLFYGDERVNPDRFTGLAARYNSRQSSVAANYENVIHGGGSGSDNASIWLVGWGAEYLSRHLSQGLEGWFDHGPEGSGDDRRRRRERRAHGSLPHSLSLGPGPDPA